jgi:PPOX class probable F420-dependent enzyme
MTQSKPQGRRAVSMTEDEVRRFLEGNMKVQVASISRDGMPHLTTLFYVLLDDKISFWTYATSQKIKNLERDPRVSALVETGTDYFELAGVSVQGTAEIVRDPAGIRRIGAAVVSAMSGGEDLGELGEQIVEQQVTKRVGVVVTPRKVASWDHAKMNALPGGASR